MAVTKNEIINRLAEKTGLPKTTVKEIVNGFLDEIKETVLNEGKEVTIHGFGKFALRYRAPRSGVSLNGEKYHFPGGFIFNFKPSKSLRKLRTK